MKYILERFNFKGQRTDSVVLYDNRRDAVNRMLADIRKERDAAGDDADVVEVRADTGRLSVNGEPLFQWTIIPAGGTRQVRVLIKDGEVQEVQVSPELSDTFVELILFDSDEGDGDMFDEQFNCPDTVLTNNVSIERCRRSDRWEGDDE